MRAVVGDSSRPATKRQADTCAISASKTSLRSFPAPFRFRRRHVHPPRARWRETQTLPESCTVKERGAYGYSDTSQNGLCACREATSAGRSTMPRALSLPPLRAAQPRRVKVSREKIHRLVRFYRLSRKKRRRGDGFC